jgi:hypothetical protein
LAPVTLPENKVQKQEIQDIQEDQELEESESRSDFHELKISAQILAYHALKFMLPAVVVIVTLACGITLSVWALTQLNKLPIQAFPASVGASDQNKADLNNKDKLKDIAPSAVHAPAQKKARKAKTQAKAHNRKYPQRHSNYQDPWADYYYEAPSHPRGGEIIHSDGMVTEYRWAKKR